MLAWLKKWITGTDAGWVRAHGVPGVEFPFPKGAKLCPEEEMILALPAELISGDETIGSVLLCNDNAELMLNEQIGVWYVKLQPGMTFSLAKSCEIVLVATDHRPRHFQVKRPEA